MQPKILMNRVHAIDSEHRRFYVESLSRKSGDEPFYYLVDMAEYKGNGQCSCEHFQIRLRPWFEGWTAVKPKETKCKHILAVETIFKKEEGALGSDV